VTPSLAARGRLILVTGLLFCAVGAIHGAAPLTALGAVIVCALLTAYLWFFPTAVLLRRRKIELSWWVPPGDQPGGALAADRPFSLHVALRNHGARRLRVRELDIMGTSGLELPRGIEAVVPRGRQVEVKGACRAHSAGYHVLHGAVIGFGDALGLFEIRAYFPNPIALKVFPRSAGLAGAHAVMRLRGGSRHERIGPHQVIRRGMAGELREIREHAAGDPFKFIAWKATARRQKLMVRDLETEIVVTYQVAIDMAGTMRDGPPGHSKLDYAIETAASLARSSLDGGDRVGLVTFDSRVYSHLRPADGYHHFLKLVDRLLETHNVVDSDLTDITNGELVAAVARYLAHQESVDVRLRRAPPLDDPSWENVQAGPNGELYDLRAMSTVVSALLKSMNVSQAKSPAPAWWWSHVDAGGESSDLRLFCRLRGIELPYQFDHEPGVRTAGLAEAVRVAADDGTDVIVLVSDLLGIGERHGSLVKSLAAARRAGTQVVVVAPFGPDYRTAAETTNGALVASALRTGERARLDRARQILARRGVPVIEATPALGPLELARRVTSARSGRRRAA